MTKLRFLALSLVLIAVSARAEDGGFPNKDMITLQAQVQQLLDAVARLQQSNDERMGVLKDLVQQNSDSVNRMSVTIDALQKQIAAQSSANGTKVDTVSGQIQALNDSLDEIKARMNRLEKAMNDVSTQQQNLTQTLQSAPAGTPANSAPTSTPANSTGTPQAASPAPGTPLSTYAASLNTPPPTPAGRNGTSAGAPLVDDMYKSAFNDFMAARYAVASAEFNDLIKAYPDAPLAGNAWYYLGEIDYRGAHYSTAVKDYDKLLEQYPDNNKIPAAHLHKGEALVQMQLKEAGIREFRALIQRFPTSPEATQARTKLNAMGVAIRPKA